ncbi:MAG: hypothetical protein P5697_17470 [Limnospira sp. PMC 1256.20]|uniref:hypothetical protein n=2 Tax=Limnospira TaxID=2596745 RepID=UPI0028E0E700|nr:MULTISPECIES: hypothetical protein [unclassified Limnospira]MDT9215258.1 hypothetical protein [Limnospira sp. PMC 1256.20]MDT9239629.1 hypothetical protein [Limnospira sp. PMC 1261.20]
MALRRARSPVSGNFQKPGFFKKRGRVYIAAGEEEYRLLNPPLQEYVTPGWLGKAIACFWKLRETWRSHSGTRTRRGRCLM